MCFHHFAVSLIRQGESRGDIEGAWARVADFYKVEAREDIELGDNAGALEPIGARFRGGEGASFSPRELEALRARPKCSSACKTSWTRGRRLGLALVAGNSGNCPS